MSCYILNQERDNKEMALNACDLSIKPNEECQLTEIEMADLDIIEEARR